MKRLERLLDQFVPDEYELSLFINADKHTFDGVATIFGVGLTDGLIKLHAKDLAVESILVDGQSADFSHEEDELTIRHAATGTRRHIIVITYHAVITDAMHGLYPCYYEVDGVKKELFATQFESHHAREVFPCVDEPAAKALFNLTLTTEPNLVVLANTAIKDQGMEDEQMVTVFETTPRMSPYLLAFVIGELQSVSGETASGVTVNVWSTLAHKTDSLSFALDFAIRSIDFFESYFDTPYPLSKSDHVALPDFSSGAMENWGLITYREIALVADPAITGISMRHYIATVIAHELSHQWFGNLVTMKWWNDLWLNESFASLMEYLAVDHLEPDWDIWLDFASNESVLALRRDSLDGVQPVRTEVNRPEEINTLFDGAIVYAKGARLLVMLKHYIGDQAFAKGLKIYFDRFAFDNTEADDLWTAMSQASGENIKRFMDPWLNQAGFPLVTAREIDDSLTLEQQRFFIGKHSESDQLWPIPLGGPEELPKILDQPRLAVPWKSGLPLQLNRGGTAHFLTRYENSLLGRLVMELAADRLDTLSRLQLLNEQTMLARAGSIRNAELIPLLEAYHTESAEAVWGVIALTVNELKKFVINDSGEQKLRAFAAYLARPQFERLGWHPQPNEAPTDTKHRAIIVSLMTYGEDEAAVGRALELFSSVDVHHLDPETRSVVLTAAVIYGPNHSAVIDRLMRLYVQTPSADLQQDITLALASTRDQHDIERLLGIINDGEIVRPQDAARWFAYLIRNPYARKFAWQWLKENWTWVENTFGGDKSYDEFPRYAAGALMTQEELEDFRATFSFAFDNPALKRTIELGITEIEARVEIIERDADGVRKALSQLNLPDYKTIKSSTA